MMTPAEFKTIRSALHLSQQGIADRLGVSLGAVRKWESGARKIPGPVVRLMEMFGKEAPQWCACQ